MIGDLKIDGKITFSKLGVTLVLGDLATSLGVIGKYAKSGRAKATLTDQVLNIGDIGTIGYFGVKNVNAPLVKTPAAPTVQALVGGATTYTYKVVAKQADGGYSVASLGTSVSAFATLDAQHWILIQWLPVDDANSYDVYRTTGGGANGVGLIANVAVGAPLVVADIGLDGNGAVAPATTPFDFQVVFGSDGTSYPLRSKGNDIAFFRWNAAAVHFKGLFNVSDFWYIVIEE